MKCGPIIGSIFSVCTLLTLTQFNPNLAQLKAANPARNAQKLRTTASPSGDSWIPDDIDHTVPPVAADVLCSLPEVLTRAGERVEELVQNVDRFTATEVLAHQSVDRSGRMQRPITLKFDYLVSISKVRDGILQVEEFRNQSRSLDIFPDHIATIGTPSLVLIFHPIYIGDFKTQCEGLGLWKGQSAWQVRFEQRRDRPNRINSFVVDGKKYEGNLRGRAWILADSYQIARLDTDQADLIPQIRLRRSHESIEYQPVSFPKTNLQLWLPSSADLYMDFKGQRFYRKHSFTDFQLFSVDTHYEVGDPKGTKSAQEPAP